MIQPISSIGSLATLPLQSGAPSAGSGSFSSLLGHALQSVNASVTQAEQQGIGLASGTSPNIASVMTTATKAELAVDMAVQVRNRAISAYDQIMNMQV
ncbi:MAG: flagellar hook-basal body complex protein FliE [Acidibacillus sp.]|uniref:Flagellar hook-basal body complex protein FliE n=1 Tax=Sulfoacidibacillus ferrooxidans TaxID=2005001 RepID=A0A9X1V8B6_9BACL|nr:flagellar hook-basal body complex protein FliE [Sulfoacidibacillus ferrooxidans]MCI0183586.1 Flagellar hook-basal body complex protein FliE [Sulfoacidibacillus ferrooxidans]MCY0892092.1 flagellar hook-basal body complex protein FliE [Acidibacillus sp.]